ncbi:hypothetical protein VQL36_16715 [Chengkuizengella sp. SCS-71B]|uniref:hypothetical protein n=1 Tax=Chengkuizengella sp. SCS-71B TaxID=3115290 RepID=UPI0032C218C0
MNKSLFIFFILILALIPSSVFANEVKWTEKRVNKELTSIGVSVELLETLNMEEKVEIAESGFTKFLGYSKSSFDLEQEQDEFTALALQDDLDFTLYYGLLGNLDGDPYIKVTAKYDWNDMPYWRLTDGFGVSWSKGWTLDQFDYTSYQVTELGNIHSSNPNYKDKSNAGSIGWTYDLETFYGDAYGTAHVYLKGTDIQGDTGEIKIWYAHDKVIGGLGLSASAATSPSVAAAITFTNVTDIVSDSIDINHAAFD